MNTSASERNVPAVAPSITPVQRQTWTFPLPPACCLYCLCGAVESGWALSSNAKTILFPCTTTPIHNSAIGNNGGRGP